MIPSEVIAKKRDHGELTDDEIGQFIAGFTGGTIADYQMSALAMAICTRGMSLREIVCLTQQMLASGDRLVWRDSRPKVDKHSTGGLGDKVSLILAPLLACCGVQVPMISGRGLGITGGTLDKLESIPGFRTNLTLAELCDQTERLGCAMGAATSQLAPADQKLYALRDVTGTVESIPLITASILSKKLAESISSLVLDVKTGSGAFMSTRAAARELATTLVLVGNQLGVRTSALLSDMNQPLGRMVGNVVEVHESVAVLQGQGPLDVRQLTCELGAELLLAEGLACDHADALRQLTQRLDGGEAYEKFARLVSVQGGRLPAPPAAARHAVLADHAGRVCRIDGRRLGRAMIELGGGRKVVGDNIDPAVGLEMLVRLGDEIMAGQPVVNILASTIAAERVTALVQSAIEIDADVTSSIDVPPLIYERVRRDDVTPQSQPS